MFPQSMFKTKAVAATPISDQPGAEKATDWKAEIRSLALILLAIMGFKSFVFSNHDIPSESMLPGLYVGDYLVVSRFAYGFSRYSVPLLPLPASLEGRIFATAPKRGDVVVFRYPGDDSQIYIKRLIGLPGDTVEVREGRVLLNGKMLDRVQEGSLSRTVEPNYQCAGNMQQYRTPAADGGLTCTVPLFRETLPGGKSYLVYDLQENSMGDTAGPFNIPARHYFMMGDNRDNSADSRFPVVAGFGGVSGVGILPEANLVGRAEFIYLSTNGKAHFWEFWKWPQGVRWQRLLDRIK